MGFLGDIGKTFVNGLSGGLASGLSGAVSGLLGNIGYNKRLNKQIKAQKQLNEQAANLNYTYGEKAAENAYKRQMEMYERSYKDQSYQAMRGQMEDAGLSVGLMYGGAGSGGGIGAMSGAPQGATGGAHAGAAEGPAAQQAANIATAELGLRMANAKADLGVKKAQIKDIEASAEAKRAEAGLQAEKTVTEQQSRGAFVEELKQRGLETWIRNITKDMQAKLSAPGLMSEESDGQLYATYENELYGSMKINSRSMINEKEAVQILQAYSQATKNEAEAKAADALKELNSARAEGYWQELLNATTHANADMIKAAAAKLSTEFNTGEYTNWKTWADLAKGIVGGAIGGAITKGIIK